MKGPPSWTLPHSATPLANSSRNALAACGRYLTFVPNPLPPPPAIEQAAIASASALLADAEFWLGQLIGLGGLLHDANALAAPYIRQEAVRSSQIEGTRTSLGELAAFEAAGGPAAGR